MLIRLHGISLGFLGGSLRDLKREGEALARFREAHAVYESLADPNPNDLFNMACDCAMVSALNGQGSFKDREKLETRAVEYLRRAIAGDINHMLTQASTDRDLDPLRRRADSQGVIADAGFPGDPFSPPSPIASSPTTFRENRVRGKALIAEGRTIEALPYLASAFKDDPGDPMLLFQVAALQAWFHRNDEFAATCRKAREFARGTDIPLVADSAAKCSSLLPTDHPTDRTETLALARLADELGKDTTSCPHSGHHTSLLGLTVGRENRSEESGSVRHHACRPSGSSLRSQR